MGLQFRGNSTARRLVLLAIGGFLTLGFMAEAAAQAGRPRSHGVASQVQAPKHRANPSVASPHTPGVQRVNTGATPRRNPFQRLRRADQQPGPVRRVLTDIGVLPDNQSAVRPVRSSRRVQSVDQRLRRAQTVDSRRARARPVRQAGRQDQGLRRLLPWNLVNVSSRETSGMTNTPTSSTNVRHGAGWHR